MLTQALGKGATLSEPDWKERRACDLNLLDEILGLTFQHRKEGRRHPVWDFLWDYYSFKPSKLRRWSAGVGSELESEIDAEYDDAIDWVYTGSGYTPDPQQIDARRHQGIRWIFNHLKMTELRSTKLDCFGLHEWAMVYRTDRPRHMQVPFRLSRKEINETVESLGLCCSHYDAFRFFTKSARPLNPTELTSESRTQFEQPGCLHANMDLYKWAYKFYPWISTELVLQGLQLAIEARRLDMEASPYDFSSFGFEAVPIETADGRNEYQRRQGQLALKAKPIRKRLIAAYESLYVLTSTPS